MDPLTPPTLLDVRAVLTAMAANPADAVNRVATFAELAQRLLPDGALLDSRPAFERGTIIAMPALFEFVGRDEPPSIMLQAREDVWIRGVTCDVIPGVGFDAIAAIYALSATYGSSARWAIEAKWRLDTGSSAQGFISRGASEVYGPGPIVLGDGEFPAALDWRLQKNQVIEVSLRSILAGIPASVVPEDFQLRAVWITFWALPLGTPQ